MLSIISDLFLIILLCSIVFYGKKFMLSLHKAQEIAKDIDPFLKNMSGYLSNILKNLDKIKNTVTENKTRLTKEISESITISEDLSSLVRNAEKIAAKLESIIDKSRNIEYQLHATLSSFDELSVSSRFSNEPDQKRKNDDLLSADLHSSNVSEAFSKPIKDTSIYQKEDNILSRLKGLR